MFREDLFELLGESLLLVARDCSLVDLTSSANVLLAHGTVVRLVRGRVAAADVAATARLRRALRQLLSPDCPACMLAVDLPREDSGPAALALLSRPPAGVPSGWANAVAMIHIAEPQERSPITKDTLRDPSEHKPAEAGVATMMPDAASLAEVARRLRLSFSTVCSCRQRTMDARPVPRAHRFDRFTLDHARGALLGPEGAEIALRPKAKALLRLLVENAQRVVSRDAIMAAVWADVVVTDESITQCVRDIRRALGDVAQALVRTVPKHGYRLAAEVVAVEPERLHPARQGAIRGIDGLSLGPAGRR